MRSRRPADADARPSDYSHRFHAGNVGDVWKHLALVTVLSGVAGVRGVHYVDTHAGEGGYALGPTGEWTEGLGRLLAVRDAAGAVGAWLAAVRRLAGSGGRPRYYPGSPALAASLLGPDARLHLVERDEAAHAALAERLRDDRRARVTRGDGLEALRALPAGETVVLVDPPWTAKAEWTDVPAALIAAAQAAPDARLVLWYPVKSLTRPNAMLARLAAAGVAATAAELVTTPLELQKNRLNGSGVVLVRPPDGAVAAIAAAAPVVGAACATHGGAWSLRLRHG